MLVGRIMKMLKFWLHNVAVAIDQLVNAIFMGYADETISSVSWRLHRDGVRSWQMWLIDTIFFWDRRRDAFTGSVIRHCEGAYLSEKYGRQLPPELRKEEQS